MRLCGKCKTIILPESYRKCPCETEDDSCSFGDEVNYRTQKTVNWLKDYDEYVKQSKGGKNE